MDGINVDEGHEQIVIYINNNTVATSLARRIVTNYVPAWMSLFLKKNHKYRKVDDHLGARGVFPDVNRKVGILEARVWDGDEPLDGSESTVEVIDDLIGHLFLMRDFLVQQDYRDKQNGEEPVDFGEPETDDEDALCLKCKRDNRNGTHDALERTGHLSHPFTPEPDEDDGPTLPAWILNTGLEPLRDRTWNLGPLTTDDTPQGRFDAVTTDGYIINMGCHPGCPIPVGRQHWHEQGNLDIVHPGPKPPTAHEEEIRKAQSWKIGEAVDRMFPRAGS